MKRLLLSIALSLSVVLSWAQFSGSGAGTESDPYRIYYADQLNEVRNFLNQSRVYFKLMSDIDLTQWISANNPGQGWEPIGTSSATFHGVFDGNNKTLTGFSINRTTNYVGLFGYTSGATVKNLTIVGNVKGGQYTGAFVGKAESGTLSGLTHQGTTNGTGYTGGIVGWSTASISGATVTGNVISNGNYIGGIVGKATATLGNTQGNTQTLSQLTFTGTVSGTTSVGGIVGEASRVSISNALVSHTVTGTGSKVGGVCGSASATGFSQCYSYCNITGQSYTGGIVGQALLTGDNHIDQCYSFGNINGTSRVGGIAGAFYTESVSTNCSPIINNSVAIGDIVTNGNYVGGIVGYIKSWKGTNNGTTFTARITVSNCYYNGNLHGADKVGGIAGIAYSVNINNNYSNAIIEGSNSVGGIVGDADISDGFSTFKIKSNMAVNPTITATSDVGRIYGTIYSGSSYSFVGRNGNTAEDNRALYDTRIILSGVTQTITDNAQNGVSNGAGYFKLKANYVGHGWDFNNDWTNMETESYPYKSWQTAPPTFSVKPKSGDTSISGQSIDGGTVFIKIGDNSESSVVCNGNSWELTGLSPLNTGEELSAYYWCPLNIFE